jgi:hypothetical protein
MKLEFLIVSNMKKIFSILSLTIGVMLLFGLTKIPLKVKSGKYSEQGDSGVLSQKPDYSDADSKYIQQLKGEYYTLLKIRKILEEDLNSEDVRLFMKNHKIRDYSQVGTSKNSKNHYFTIQLAFNLLEFSHGERPSEIHSES